MSGESSNHSNTDTSNVRDGEEISNSEESSQENGKDQKDVVIVDIDNSASKLIAEAAHSNESNGVTASRLVEDGKNSFTQANKTTEEQKTQKPKKSAPYHPDGPSVILSQRQIIITFIGLMLGMFLAALDQTIVATALPSIIEDFGRLDLYSWVVISYLLTCTTVIPLTGRFSDIFGRKILFQGSMLIFLIGSILSGASTSMVSLIIFRALQGLGGGSIFSLVQIIIGDILTVRERGKYGGLIGLTFAMASVLGPVVGGVLTTNLSWRWIFYVNVPVGILGIIFVQFALKLTVPEKKNRREVLLSIDYLGSLSSVAAVVMLLLGVSFGGNQYSWNSPVIILLLVGGFIIMLLFLWNEHRATHPIMPLEQFLVRNVIFDDICSFALGYLMYGVLNYLPVFFQMAHGDTPTVSGLKLLPVSIGVPLSSTFSGIVVQRTGHFWYFNPGAFAFATISLGLFGKYLAVGANIYVLSVIEFILGIGLGLCVQTLVIVVQAAVPRNLMAGVTATNTFIRMMGGAVGVAVFGAILTNELSNQLPPALESAAEAGRAVVDLLPPQEANMVIDAYVSSLQTVFYSSISAAVMGFISSLFIRKYVLELQHPVAAPPEKGVKDGPVELEDEIPVLTVFEM